MVSFSCVLEISKWNPKSQCTESKYSEADQSVLQSAGFCYLLQQLHVLKLQRSNPTEYMKAEQRVIQSFNVQEVALHCKGPESRTEVFALQSSYKNVTLYTEDIFLLQDRGPLQPSLFSKVLASLPAFPNMGILGQCHIQKISGVGLLGLSSVRHKQLNLKLKAQLKYKVNAYFIVNTQFYQG